jgi:hypothetical protein
MSLEALEKVVKEDTIPFEVAEKYLNLFLGKSDWDNHLKRLWTISASKNSTEEQRKNFVKKAISCAIMLPLLEGTTIPSPPDKLLFWCTAWTQFNEKDWFKLFQENIEEDIKITKDRNAIIMLGVVDPIDVSPLTRQAFNWLYNRAKEVSDLNEYIFCYPGYDTHIVHFSTFKFFQNIQVFFAEQSFDNRFHITISDFFDQR